MAEEEKQNREAAEQPQEGKKKKLSLPLALPKLKKGQQPAEEAAADKEKADKPDKPAENARGKLAKKGKAPKPAKEKKGKKAKGARPARKTGGCLVIVVLLALLTALLLVGAAVYYFDLFSLRSKIFEAANNVLIYLDEDYRPFSEALREREIALNAREQEQESAFAAREEDLQQREADLTTQSGRLDKRASALDTREKKLNEQQVDPMPLYRQELSAEKLAELKNLGKIYSAMEAEVAALAISQLSTSIEMAEVLFYMDNAAAAALLSVLEPEIAAQITREMLRE